MIIVMKLLSGEEIISTESEYQTGMNEYSKPRVLQAMQTERGVQAALVPWMITSPDGTFPIDDKFIITKVEASREVGAMYLQQTTSLDLTAATPNKIQL